MIEIVASQVNELMIKLFDMNQPQIRRCFAVLEGIDPQGKIFVDDLQTPTAAVVQESFDKTVFVGGSLSIETLLDLIDLLRARDFVLMGVHQTHHNFKELIEIADKSWPVLEFYNRSAASGWATTGTSGGT